MLFVEILSYIVILAKHMLYSNNYNSQLQLSSDNVVECICHNKIANVVAVYDVLSIFSDVYHQLFCHTAAASVARHIHWRPAAAGVAGAVWR